MFTSTITRPKLQTAVLKWFADEDYSFEQETALANSAASLTPANLMDVGLIVGKVAAAAAGAASANAGNTGNGTVGAVSDLAGIQVGTYAIEFIAATKFNVYDPGGRLVGEGTTGVAFATQLGFTITAGGTAFVAGDGFTIAVGAGSGKVVPLSLTATDGSAVPIGVVVRQQTVSASADAPVVVVERLAVLLADGLIYPSGATTNQKNAINAQLAALGLIVRLS
jgi:hypothetical protein